MVEGAQHPGGFRGDDAVLRILHPREDGRPLRIALLVALAAHLVLLGVVFPAYKSRVETATISDTGPFVLRPWVPPPRQPEREMRPPAKTAGIPLPDATPEDLEPVRRAAPVELPGLDDGAEIVVGVPTDPPAAFLRVGRGGIPAPRRVRFVEPEYTRLAQAARVEGEVALDIVIDETGRVAEVEVLGGLPMGLTEAAVAAVRQWRYEPSTMYGRPRAVRMTLRVRFEFE